LYQRIALEGLSVTSVDQYVDIALTLGMDRDRNLSVRQAIREQVDVLFENPADVKNWSDALRSWVEEMR
jgi:predicted O-linked N-acetylglucosamine transferase (SPINDLY family)